MRVYTGCFLLEMLWSIMDGSEVVVSRGERPKERRRVACLGDARRDVEQ